MLVRKKKDILENVRNLLYLNSRDLIATNTEMGEIVHVFKVLSPENTNDVAADVQGL
jgi:hypothetical protein